MYAQFRPAGKEGDFNAYIIKSFRTKKGEKTSSIVVEKLGRLSRIAEAHPGIDPRNWVEQRAKMLTEEEKADSHCVTLRLSPTKRISPDRKRIVHGGDILLQPFFYELGIDTICEEISSRSKFKYDLTDIMKKIVLRKNWLRILACQSSSAAPMAASGRGTTENTTPPSSENTSPCSR